ncbi:ABC transporter ATP-binding protein [Sneathia sanguinegens]|uniref:ABC transporter ATP-binding protein n=1 Tax=Sneathia sanguinegens TaxID=40543 RepID=UPI0008375A9E|nr:ABC transporter ATP-binding protein [Sneathia sanguinegens]MDU4652290.1 ABC transporter ATP-binding protein [Sneathia sanguinegens]MDU7497441.1 ABC transporter ATP-binding protein [Sneathia sanguinegens]
MEKDLEILNISKAFGEEKVLKNVNLSIRKGEFFSILGPSGCGKTTLLRMIAGFISPDEGQIKVNGERIDILAPNKRNVNTVFQNYALFPNMTVFDNIAFPLKLKKMKKDEIKREVNKYLDLVGLQKYAKKYPISLSGGQKQRVSIARALINKPEVLLLDEPLSALDAKLRQKLLIDLDDIHDEVGITFVFVTHDQEEALSVSDRIAVMHNGNVLQVGTPNEIYETPADTFVADFIGETNFIYGKIKEVYDNYAIAVSEEIGEFKVELDKPVKVGNKVKLTLRPEKIKVDNKPPKANEKYKILQGIIDEVIYSGFQSKLFIKIEGSDRIIKAFDQHREFLEEDELFEWKEKVYFYWNYEDAYLVEVM